MNKNIIILIICLTILPMVIAVPEKGFVYKYEPVLLTEGWNGIGIIPDYSTLVQGDFNISLVNDSSSGTLNLLGMSFVTPNGKCISLNSLTFWDAQDNSLGYEDAKTNNWINPINFTEVKPTITLGKEEKFNKLCPYEAIWVRSFLAINMTISDVLGSPIGETFDWADLRFRNSSGIELNVSDALTTGWLTTDITYYTGSSFDTICGSLEDCDSLGPLNAWQGYFVFSAQDNLHLLTNNETKKNKVKIKCYAKYVNENKVCKMPKGRAKYIGANKVFKFSIFNSHIIRLIGSSRKTIG